MSVDTPQKLADAVFLPLGEAVSLAADRLMEGKPLHERPALVERLTAYVAGGPPLALLMQAVALSEDARA